MDIRHGQMEGEAGMVEWVWHRGGRDKAEEQAGRSAKRPAAKAHATHRDGCGGPAGVQVLLP